MTVCSECPHVYVTFQKEIGVSDAYRSLTDCPRCNIFDPADWDWSVIVGGRPSVRRAHNLPLKSGRIYEARISHDDWCPLLKGGPCRCDPDIEQVDITPET